MVTFQPGVLHWLSGVNTSELTNTFVDAAAVFGDSIAVLAGRRARAIDIHTRAAIVESSMRSALGQLEALTTDATTAAARRLQGDDGWRSDLGALICASGYSSSQFRRRFARQTGLSPKCYARLCRLTAVIGLMERAPQQSWADCAQAAGCFDQAHLTHDFRQPMRITPSRFLRQQQLQLL